MAFDPYSAMATAAPYILSLFNRQKKPNPQQDYIKAFGTISNQLSPYLSGLNRTAAASGQAMNQNLGKTFAMSGLSSTGVGQIGKEIGNSFQGNAVAQSNADFGQLIAQLAGGLGSQMTAAGQTPGAWQNFQGLLGSQMAGGANPFMDIRNMFKKPKVQTGSQPREGE